MEASPDPDFAPDLAALLGLLQRASTVFGAETVAEAVPRRKAIVFVHQAAAAAEAASVDEAAAQRAVEALTRVAALVQSGSFPCGDALPSPADLLALAQCIRFMRPSLLIQDGALPESPALALTGAQKAAIDGVIGGVGAIGRPFERTGIATGFLVGPRALVTNQHVVDQLAGAGATLPRGEAVVRFGLEWDRLDRADPIPIKGELARHPAEDLVVLELEADAPIERVLPLAAAPTLAAGQPILVVGYPADDRRCPAWAKLMFENKYRIKRASPGAVVGFALGRLLHDASTLGGNSGSPVFDCERGAVVGIHAEGVFALENRAVTSAAVWASEEVRRHVTRWV
jgi:S1-C subfamily serine protease